MIEYCDFYDNLQASAETLQCPRCSASVPANPGVCGNCGENVFQCHKCRYTRRERGEEEGVADGRGLFCSTSELLNTVQWSIQLANILQ